MTLQTICERCIAKSAKADVFTGATIEAPPIASAALTVVAAAASGRT